MPRLGPALSRGKGIKWSRTRRPPRPAPARPAGSCIRDCARLGRRAPRRDTPIPHMWERATPPPPGPLSDFPRQLSPGPTKPRDNSTVLESRFSSTSYLLYPQISKFLHKSLSFNLFGSPLIFKMSSESRAKLWRLVYSVRAWSCRPAGRGIPRSHRRAAGAPRTAKPAQPSALSAVR